MARDADQWSNDPSVRMMRRIFARLEAAQHELLKQLDISPLDVRLRRGRESALPLFERAWERANSRGMGLDEQKVAILYVQCLRWALVQTGIAVPEDIYAQDDEVKKLLREVLP